MDMENENGQISKLEAIELALGKISNLCSTEISKIEHSIHKINDDRELEKVCCEDECARKEPTTHVEKMSYLIEDFDSIYSRLVTIENKLHKIIH